MATGSPRLQNGRSKAVKARLLTSSEFSAENKTVELVVESELATANESAVVSARAEAKEAVGHVAAGPASAPDRM
jgi:hypothetical protein